MGNWSQEAEEGVMTRISREFRSLEWSASTNLRGEQKMSEDLMKDHDLRLALTIKALLEMERKVPNRLIPVWFVLMEVIHEEARRRKCLGKDLRICF